MTEKKDKEIEFSRLVKEHKDTIYTVCYMFSQDKDEVNDLFQDVLINLWKGYGSFRGESKLDTWIWRVSLNTCISADRKKKKAGQRVPLDMEADFLPTTTRTTARCVSSTPASAVSVWWTGP